MAPRQNRHILRELCPPWLRGPQAYSFLNEGIFTIYDIDAELWWQALLARFPSYCPADALSYLATDRRIIRFEQVSPFFSAKRALFWNEVLKAKAFAPSFLFRLLRIGKVVVESHESGGENVYIDNVFLFDDVANYIDKIINEAI